MKNASTVGSVCTMSMSPIRPTSDSPVRPPAAARGRQPGVGQQTSSRLGRRTEPRPRQSPWPAGHKAVPQNRPQQRHTHDHRALDVFDTLYEMEIGIVRMTEGAPVHPAVARCEPDSDGQLDRDSTRYPPVRNVPGCWLPASLHSQTTVCSVVWTSCPSAVTWRSVLQMFVVHGPLGRASN